MTEWHTMSNTPACLKTMTRRMGLLIEVAHNLGVRRSEARSMCRLDVVNFSTPEKSANFCLQIHPQLKVILDAGKYSKMPNKKA